MIRWIGVVLLSVAVMPVGDAAARVLSCADFKLRLDQALQGSGAASPAIAFGTTQQINATVRQTAWSAAGLSGRLTCSGDDFADFYMAVDPTMPRVGSVPNDLAGFKSLGAASICALSAGQPDACRTLMATMSDESVQQFREDIHDGDDRPQGLRDYQLAPGLDAVLLLTPQAMSFAVGPGIHATANSQRPTLAPKERDEDE